MTGRRAADQSVGARHAVPVFSISPNPTVNLNPLEATLTKFAATIANKGFTEILSSLNATLTKYAGGAVDTHLHAAVHSVRARHAVPVLRVALSPFLVAQEALSLPPSLPMRLLFSPVTSYQSPVTIPHSRVAIP